MGQNNLSTGRSGSILVEEQAAVLLSGKETWGNRIHTNVVRRPLTGKELGQIDYSRFCCRIGDNAREGKVGRNAGNIDDAAFTLFLHCGAKYLAGEKSAGHQIHVKTFPPIRGANSFKRMFGGDSYARVIATGGV